MSATRSAARACLGIIGFLLSILLISPVHATISGAYIDSAPGSSAIQTNVTITPDQDGTTDMAYMRFTWTSADPATYPSGWFRIIVDTDGDASFEPPDWSADDPWADADSTLEGWWINSGQSVESMWEGRDNMWRVLANGTYNIRILVDLDGNWSTTGDQSVDNSLSVILQTASISGTVTSGGSALTGVRVNAGCQNGWGEARTASDGTYTISGLKAGNYNVNAEKSGYVGVNYPGNIAVTAGQNVVGVDFSMSASVQITGAISIPAAFAKFQNMWGGWEDQLWINVNGWSTAGQDWVWGNAHIHASDSSVCSPAPTQDVDDDDNDGRYDYDECASLSASTFSLDVNPPASGQTKTYKIRAEAEGYASVEYSVTVGESGGTQNITMTKASRVYGTVTLPSANTGSEPIWVDVNARTSDGNMVWGGGSVDIGQTVGNFDIRSALAGTYTVEVRVMGYKTTTVSDLAVTAGQDTNLGNLTVSQGASVSGTITISGNTSTYRTNDGQITGDIRLWVDAWSPSSNGWSGTQVSIPRGDNQSASYTIGGLNAGTYEIHAWLGEGYEQTPMPLTASVDSDSSAVTGVSMTFAPYGGAISGTVSGSGLDLSKVVVKATKAGWEWQAPIMKLPSSDGSYLLEGLGTSEYILEVNEYANAGAYMSDPFTNPGQPTGNFGAEIRRVPVMNGSTTSGQDITLSTGGSISGTVSLEAGYSGGVHFGSGSDPDLNLAGQMVVAVPMKMAMMGGSSVFMGQIQADGTYTISGLGAGAYMVSPPTQLTDPSEGFGGGGDFQMMQEMYAPDIAGDSTMVSITAGEVKADVDFTMSDGYTVSGTITLPELPSGDPWNWVCELEVRHPRHEGKGRHMPVFVRDFNGTKSYSFTLQHVAEGSYVVQTWTPNYTVAYKNITVSSTDVVGVNLTLKKGANIKGKLVDAGTGEAISPEDGVRVRCEAWPWVEGSWRETFQDPWSESKFLQTGGKYTGEFRLANLPAGSYVVTVEASHGMKRNGAKNYVGVRKAGVVVPSTEGATVDIGTLQLREGVTISGTVTSAATGLPIGNIQVEAEPADEKDGSTASFATTDAKGNYKVYGVDPNVKYYYVIGGSRPDFMEFVPVTWGEVEKDVEVTAAGLTGVDFALPAANASLSGTLHKTGSGAWRVPFMDEDMPAPLILLQRQGAILIDPMDGIEAIGEPSSTDTTTFSIDGIVPGTYNLKVFCLGYTTKIVRGIVIAEGANTLSQTVELVEGGTVSGSVIKEDGTYPTTTDISQAVVVSADLDTIIFGTVTSNAASREVSAYSVSGLAAGKSYYVVFVNDSDGGAEEIHVMPDAVQAGQTYNAVIGDNPPIITARAKKNGDGTFSLGMFSTSYLNDASASDILSVTQGGGSLSATLGGDKMQINATYTPAAGDTIFTIALTAHYGKNNSTVTGSFSYDVNSTAWNQGKVNSLMGGMVGMGQGDKAKVFFEPGAITEADGDGVSIITIQKDDSAVSGNAISVNGIRTQSLLAEATPSLPSTVTTPSALYDIALPSGDSVTTGLSVTVSLPYSDSAADTANVNVFHYTGGEWVQESTNRTVDTVNKTITVDVTSLSPFQTGVGTISSSSSSSTTAARRSSSGGCTLSGGPVALQDGLAETLMLLLPLIGIAAIRLRRSRMN